MPREEERPVQQSVLDRVTGPDTDGTGLTRMQSVRELRASVRRDLEWLLNTRAVAIPPPEPLTELRKSVYTYGLSDITSFSADDPKSRIRLRHMIEEAIAQFEPRLTGVQVSDVAITSKELRQLRFSIQALLRMDPSPERVSFDTVLDIASGAYVVRGEAGA